MTHQMTPEEYSRNDKMAIDQK